MPQKCLAQKPSWDGSCDDCNYKNCDNCKKTQKVIGIVGNRTGWKLFEVIEKINQTHLVTTNDAIISGGALGVLHAFCMNGWVIKCV